jgi:hypothetical protein
VATTFTRLAGLASVFRARVAALFALDVRFRAELFRPELFLAELFLAVPFFEVLFLAELFLPAALFLAAFFLVALFLDAFFRAALFLVVAVFFRPVLVLRFRAPPRVLPLVLFFAAVLRFRVLVARFLGDAPLFDVERVRLVLLRPVLRLVAPLRAVDFRLADFALEFPRDDFLVVAIHALRVSSRTGATRSCMASFGRAGGEGRRKQKAESGEQ